MPISVVWDSKEKCAYYVDYGVPFCNASNPCLFRYDSIADKTCRAHIKRKTLAAPSFIVPIQSKTKDLKRFAVGFGKTVYIVEWIGCSRTAKIISKLFTLDPSNPTTRLAIGHRDVSGHSLYVGNINNALCSGPANGSIYRYTKELGLVQTIRHIRLPGGYGFDQERGYVYILDTCSLTVSQFKSDCDSKICKGKVILDFKNYGKIV